MPCPEWYMSHQRWPTSFGLTNALYINFVLTKWEHFSNILSPRFRLVTLLKIYRKIKPGSCLQSFEECRNTGHNLQDPCFNLLTSPIAPVPREFEVVRDPMGCHPTMPQGKNGGSFQENLQCGEQSLPVSGPVFNFVKDLETVTRSCLFFRCTERVLLGHVYECLEHGKSSMLFLRSVHLLACSFVAFPSFSGLKTMDSKI